jgi:hypothetical protein
MEPIGVATLLLGILCLWFGPALSILVFIPLSLFGSAAAIILTGLNQSSVQPAYLMLCILAIDILRRQDFHRQWLDGSTAGYWLMATVVYGVGSTLLLPRLFEGSVDVYVVRAIDAGQGGRVSAIPLGPSAGNITQSIYFIADLVCFMLFSAYARMHRGIERIGFAMLVCAFANIAFGIIDIVTYQTNTVEILSFMRNASYRMLDAIEFDGLKRIVGSFSEASVFAFVTLALFVFTASLWSEGVTVYATGTAAAASLVALLLSTSSTAYVMLAIILPVQYIAMVIRVQRQRAAKRIVVLTIAVPIIFACIVCAIYLYEPLSARLENIANQLIYQKLASDSGIERASWNTNALAAFYATYGLGAGIGSVRASSWIVAVLSNIGIIGALTYFTFIAIVLLPRRKTPDTSPTALAVQKAAKLTCGTQLLITSMTAGSIALGLLFFVFAAVATTPLTSALPRRTMRPASQSTSVDQPIPAH